jgi:hypothetical protein
MRLAFRNVIPVRARATLFRCCLVLAMVGLLFSVGVTSVSASCATFFEYCYYAPGVAFRCVNYTVCTLPDCSGCVLECGQCKTDCRNAFGVATPQTITCNNGCNAAKTECLNNCYY